MSLTDWPQTTFDTKTELTDLNIRVYPDGKAVVTLMNNWTLFINSKSKGFCIQIDGVG